MKQKKIVQAMSTLGLLSCISVPLLSFAQSTDPVQRIEVTGSSIKRSNQESAGSVQIMTRDEIERSGATTALGILTDSVAVDTVLNSATVDRGNFATGLSVASMRSLPAPFTLVLVNGRRIAQYGLADGGQRAVTNLDAIPSEAIERIEVLKDGASAIYGSDAVAGVINIILRKNFKGGKIKAGYYTAENFSDLRSRNLSAIYGFGDVDKDGFNTYFTFDAYKRDAYTTGDLRSKYPDWHRLTPGRSTWDAKSVYSPTGNYYLSSTNRIAAPGCPSENIDTADSNLCKFDTLSTNGLTTDNKRYAFASNTNFKLGADTNANFEVTYAKATDDYIVGESTLLSPTTSSVWYNVIDQKIVGPYQAPRLPVGHPNNPYTVPVEFRARLMDTGNGFNFTSSDATQYRAMLSLDGSLGSFDWKSAAGYMASDAIKSIRNTSAKGYTDAIVSGAYKFGQQNDRALLESMFPVRSTIGNSQVSFIDATISGEIYRLPAGAISFALGANLLHEGYEMKASDNVLKGELVSVFGLQVKDKVTKSAIFSEVRLPLLKNLELGAALRADKVGSFDPHISPKMELRYNPTDSLLLRGTASGGFRAPNIVESGSGLGRSSVPTALDPIRCPTAIALNDIVQKAANATSSDKSSANAFRNTDCSAGVPTFTVSNPNIEPETSRSYTLGLVFSPSKQWSFALDYYDIEIANQIGTRTAADILKDEANLPAGQLIRVDNSAADSAFIALAKKYAPTTALNFNNVGRIGFIYSPYVNSGKTRASGFDFDITSRFKIQNVGDLRVALQGNYDLNFQTYSQALGTWNKNIKGEYDGKSRLQTKLSADLKTGNWVNTATIDYTSGYSTNSVDSPTYCVTQKVASEYMATCSRVDASTIVNWNLSYTGFKNTKLNLNVGNLFEADAPIDWRGGWSSRFRTFNVSATYNF